MLQYLPQELPALQGQEPQFYGHDMYQRISTVLLRSLLRCPLASPLYLSQVDAETHPFGKDPMTFAFSVTLTRFGAT